MSPRLLLGVDGGNTKTVAVVLREDGEVLAQAQGGATDIHVCASPETALVELARIVHAALASANVKAADLSTAAFSLAGADWPEDFGLLRQELLARIGLKREPVIVNDAMGALRSGAPDWQGAVIACGTFNAIGARNRDGRIFHVGFWPDHAGGFDIGLAALKAVYRAALGLGPQTQLVDAALAHYGVADWRALMHTFTRLEKPAPMRDAQQLAPLALSLAAAGDAVARTIVDHGADVLAGQARVAAKGVDLGPHARLVLTGGVLQKEPGVLRAAILDRLPAMDPVLVRSPPVLGALALALDDLGVELPEHRISAVADRLA